MKMGIFEATMIAEGQYDLAGYTDETITRELIVDAWQLLIDTGTCWKLQGYFGRGAQAMIDAGHCTRAEHETA
jgi:hypothetical protein